jgi:hypothetical protein
MDIELQASIAKVTLKTKDVSGLIVRRCRMAFDRELDAEIARALGSGAKKALTALGAHEMTKVVLSIDSIEAKAVLVAGAERCEIEIVRGERATCTSVSDDDDDTVCMIRLEFETSYHDDVWSFLGRNCGSYVRITFTDRQLELPMSPGAKAGKAAAAALKKFKDAIPEGTTVSVNGHEIA